MQTTLNKINTFSERKIVKIFLPISLNTCFGAQTNRLIETVLFEYPEHMLWLRNEKINVRLFRGLRIIRLNNATDLRVCVHVSTCGTLMDIMHLIKHMQTIKSRSDI